MCKRKENIEKIKGFQTEVNFRLDYYARPGSLDKLFANLPKNMDYFENKPTEEEQQIIGLDDVARCLDKSLTELLFYPCKVLKSKEGRDITIYIHRNFISVQIFTSSADENEKIVEYVRGILQPFLDEDEINIEDLSIRVSFAEQSVSTDDLWNVFDHTAFPVIDDTDVKSGTYQDTRQVGELYIDLMRSIQTNEDDTLDGVVSTVAICSEDSLRKGIELDGLKSLLESVLQESIYEITRCFAE